jgi:lipoprotein-anchoring transpeptidase ErfK/SrfK
MRALVFVLLLVAAGLLAADLRPASAPPRAAAAPTRQLAQASVASAPRVVEVAFVRKGWVVRVERALPRGAVPQRFALRELLKGPTAAERRQGIRTALPTGARLRSARARGDLWLVSLNRDAFEDGGGERNRTRLWQIAATLAPLGPKRYVAIATAGRFLTVQRLGVRPGSWRSVAGENEYRFDVRGVQRQLALLGYLAPSDVTGALDYPTEQALLAFQAWTDITRTGTVTGRTQLALFGASRPRAKRDDAGRHVEIYRALGVTLLVDGGEVVRVVHASTGAGGTTPVGDFRVYLKSLLSWSVPFEVWMPFAAYFHGGIAMHQSPDVPSYSASHGCVRLPRGDAKRVYDFVDVGTPVFVR